MIRGELRVELQFVAVRPCSLAPFAHAVRYFELADITVAHRVRPRG